MKKILYASALVTALATVTTAQAVKPWPAPRPMIERVAELRDAALQDTLAWEITEGLTTEIGQRLAGTEAEAQARDWAVAKLTALGFKNIRVENFDIPSWVRGEERAEVVSPFPQKLVVAALGNSAATPPEGLTGEIVAFDGVAALEAASEDQVRGKIVFVDHNMSPTQSGSGYSYFGPVRRQAPSIASRKGAIAIVIRPLGTDHHRNPHTGNQNFAKDVTPIPAASLSVLDAEQLKRILKRGKPVTLHLTLTPRNLGPRQSGNVIAEVPGSDPDAGIVLVAGHLDSWDLATGAIDDASGVAIVTAAAKRIMDAGQPRRTIRVVWFGSEEPGLLGANVYRDKYRNEKHALIAESDEGADRIWQFNSHVTADAQPMADRVMAALAPLGIAKGRTDEADGSDISVLSDIGVPIVQLQQDAMRYFDYHHTPDDTLDKVDLKQLQQNVAAWTAMLAIAANDPLESGMVTVKSE